MRTHLAGDVAIISLYARGAFARGEHRDLPAVPVGETLIHVVEIVKKRGLSLPVPHLEVALFVGIVLGRSWTLS